MKKIITLISILLFLSLVINMVFAQETKKLTQEQFAVQLVKNMKLQNQLPIAALPSDCVKLLDNLGVSPLGGWDRKALLTEEDYTVIVAKAVGKENLVNVKAAEFCQKNINAINQNWQKGPKKSLAELMNDKTIFPKGVPQCPYGLKYKDKDKNHQVDPHYHPVVFYQ